VRFDATALAVSGLALGWIILPFYGAIMWALIIAMLCVPGYRWLLPRLKGRRNLTAGLVMLLVLLVGVIPFALMTASLAREASTIYYRIDSGNWNPGLFLRGLFDALPPWITALLERAGMEDFEHLQRQATTSLAEGSQFIATQAFSIGLDTFSFVASLGVTLYLSFFMIRDGDELVQIVKSTLPIPQQYKRVLFDKFMTVVRATVKGSLLVAAIQGTLGGIAFSFLGVKGGLIWAVLMAFLSLLPLIGTSLVWMPVAVYFLLVGSAWKTLVLIVYGVVVHGLVDNFLRPILIGKDARMPDYVVMITTLGGMSVFGINGFIIGPTIAAMFIAVWHLSIMSQPQLL
jgi:predicted PurR-regulated permease PerM